jgi:peptidoglycan/LPS O-acetylase OafA/YrhL
MNTSPAALGRNGRIDLLRGVSILLVVIHHLALRISLGSGPLGAVLPKRVIDGFCFHGYEAVFVFFVLSGFLITSLILLGGVGCGAILFADDLLWWALRDGELLVLTLSTACMAIAFRWQQTQWGADGVPPSEPLRGTRWICAFGRRSYEIYLTHMFVVYALVRAFHASGSNLNFGILWFPAAVALSWILGTLVDRTLSTPCNRWLRKRFSVA